MTSYQKLKHDRDLLSKEYKILYKACINYLATAKITKNEDYYKIAEAINEVRAWMLKGETK